MGLKTKKSTIRLTVDFSKEGYGRLEQLAEIVDARSKADVIRDALRVYEYFAKKSKQGAGFCVVEEDEHKSIVLFGLTSP